ncbi:hypothetical protein CXG81DRAFT_24124 [Caulochytrium protostelioides]|uniref:Rrp15p-domain-containing protein n=1 Tax=Caulochytrium protostelioides TaxID=1555241 RepID=A0A4V1IV91_9FUNG|nr:hypothetical protein CXG81DRAFT_24124 [Caulochytrium protostelioides]|eukprot:RKP03239.1 hypothetical protein CXG81DRAFT_24124 [Caulochytrium protostelioides]
MVSKTSATPVRRSARAAAKTAAKTMSTAVAKPTPTVESESEAEVLSEEAASDVASNAEAEADADAEAEADADADAESDDSRESDDAAINSNLEDNFDVLSDSDSDASADEDDAVALRDDYGDEDDEDDDLLNDTAGDDFLDQEPKNTDATRAIKMSNAIAKILSGATQTAAHDAARVPDSDDDVSMPTSKSTSKSKKIQATPTPEPAAPAPAVDAAVGPILSQRLDLTKQIAEAKLDAAARNVLLQQRHAMLERNHVLPRIERDLAPERQLRRLATRGVVRLFNALTAAQRARGANAETGHLLPDAPEASVSKSAFLDMLRRDKAAVAAQERREKRARGEPVSDDEAADEADAAAEAQEAQRQAELAERRGQMQPAFLRPSAAKKAKTDTPATSVEPETPSVPWMQSDFSLV